MAENQSNVPPEENEEVESKESKNNSDWEGPWRHKTSMTKFKNDFREMQATIASLRQQNQILIEMVQRQKNSSLDGSNPSYMKNVPKLTTWDTKDKNNIEILLTEYETYCDALGYIGDEVRMRNFGSFLKGRAVVSFASLQNLTVK